MLGDGIVYNVPWWAYATPPALIVAAWIAEEYDFGKKFVIPALKFIGAGFVALYVVYSMLPITSLGDFIFTGVLVALVIFAAYCVFSWNG